MRTSKIQSGLAGLMVSYKVSGLGLFIQSTPKIENCLKGFRVWASKGTSFYRVICTLWGPRAVLGQDAHLLEEKPEVQADTLMTNVFNDVLHNLVP